MHQSYMYTISDQIDRPYETYAEEDDFEKQKPKDWQYTASGFYIYDIKKLFSGKVEKYKLANAIGGVCNIIDNSRFSDRFSFIQDYDTVAVIPFPHINLIKCIGMGQKADYVIWRERNGFFSALDRHSNLKTWSLISGKLLYSEEQKQDGQELPG